MAGWDRDKRLAARTISCFDTQMLARADQTATFTLRAEKTLLKIGGLMRMIWFALMLAPESLHVRDHMSGQSLRDARGAPGGIFVRKP